MNDWRRILEIPIADIIVLPDRFRKTFNEVQALAGSFTRVGLINPILVCPSKDHPGKWDLVAGERRFRAAKLLGWETIRAETKEELTELSSRRIELEENLCREDLTWQEQAHAVAEIHRLMQEEHGKADTSPTKEGWGVDDTAEMLGHSAGWTSQKIQLSGAIEVFPELAQEKKATRALKKYSKMKDLAFDMILAKEALKSKDPESPIQHIQGDAREILPELGPESVDFINFDPPWGIGIDESGILREKSDYEDGRETSLGLVKDLLPELYRVLKPNRYLLIWTAETVLGEVLKLLGETFDSFSPIAGIWDKKTGGQPKPYDLAPQTEFFVVAMKGKRELPKQHTNVFVCSRVPPSQKIHTAEKPVELMKEILNVFSLEGETVMDPTMGSGAVLRAAKTTNRFGMGIEIDRKSYTKAVAALEKVEVPK